MEALPAKWIELLDRCCHVLLPVERANDGVELEFDPEVAAPVTNQKELLDVLACPTPDLDVGGLIKAVAADAQDVNIDTVLLQPSLGNLGTVGDDRDRFEAQIDFAVLTQHGELFRIKERLTPSKVDLLHASALEKLQPTLHVVLRRYMACLFRVKTEATDLVAFASEVVVDRDWLGFLFGLTIDYLVRRPDSGF